MGALAVALLMLAPMGSAGLREALEASMPLVPPAVREAAVVNAASACFNGTPDRTFDVVAIEANIVYNHFGDRDPFGRMYVLSSQEAAVRAVTGPDARDANPLVQPLVLRAHLGDCVEVKFTNRIDDTPFPLDSLSQGLTQHTTGPLFGLEGIVDDALEQAVDQLPELPRWERASMHVHKLLTAMTGQGSHVGQNPDSTAGFSESVTYRWYIPDDASYEGAHLFHSHGDTRYQAAHGLFGAIVAEPQGYDWLDPTTGAPLAAGWEAMLSYPTTLAGKADNPDFREYVLMFHDEIEPCERDSAEGDCTALRNVDDNRHSGAYGPQTKAINYRSESFMRRFIMVEQDGYVPVFGSNEDDSFNAGFDDSQAYGTYSNGESAQPISRAYVGDPAKIRLVHGGPGQHHSFHLHGGGDRWRFQPETDDTQFGAGFIKVQDPSKVRARSDRLDVQNIGPGESFNLVIEGGAGGVQQSVGDFLYHCHIVEHYVAGMWGIWRVYNTLQDGTDPNFPGQAALKPLPDRVAPASAVSTAGLVGKVLFPGTPAERMLVSGPSDPGASPPEVNVDDWVRSFLPAQGVPRHNDASVWDWRAITQAGKPLYLGEPEVNRSWENYQPQTSGLWFLPGDATGRPELRFDPATGRPAYPMLHPHLGKRPPFAPDHGPTPYLGPEYDPVANPLGLCPQHPDRTDRSYNVVALSTPVRYNSRDLDAAGEIFVHAEDKATVQGDPTKAENLILRANVHDCVDITFTSALEDIGFNQFHSKVNMHIHLVQFDVQGSDGVITGLNFEQSIRPASTGAENTNLSAAAAAGTTVLQVADTGPFYDAAGNVKVGSRIGIGLTEANVELRRVVAVDAAAGTVTLDAPLANDHAAAEYVGYEFVSYRWYPDVELGIVYWHDHVAGIRSWSHGLFGGIVVEPAGSTWTDPATGARVRDGTAATAGAGYASPSYVDIHPPGEPSHREFVASLQDRNYKRPGGMNALVDPYASINLRNAPLDLRLSKNADPAYLFSSAMHGDPSSSMPRAYPGDPVVVRLLFAGQSTSRGVTTFGISGHRFQLEAFQPKSNVISTISLGEANQFNFRLLCGAGSGWMAAPGDPATCQGWHAGDYMYYLSADDSLRGGAWGLFRVFDKRSSSLVPLPDRPAPTGPVDTGFPSGVPVLRDYLDPIGPLPADPLDLFGDVPAPPDGVADVGPKGAPVRHFDVAAIALPTSYNKQGTVQKPGAAMYALLDDVPALLQGLKAPEPLVLRANAGEVVEVTLTNLLASPPVDTWFTLAEFIKNFEPAFPQEKGSMVYPQRVGMAPTLLAVDPQRSGGITTGWDADQSVPLGKSITYRWYADLPMGAAYLSDWSQVIRLNQMSPEGFVPNELDVLGPTGRGALDAINNVGHVERGLYGMLIIEPEGSLALDPATLQPKQVGASAVVVPRGGAPFREYALMLESTDNQFESSTMSYHIAVHGLNGMSYRAEPLPARIGMINLHECHFDPDDCISFGMREYRSPLLGSARSSVVHGDPSTPLLEAFAGEDVVLRVVGANGAQLHTFTVEGHSWNLVPEDPDSNRIDVVTVGPGEAANIHLVAGGGLKDPADAAGDYLYGDHRGGMLEQGIWGVLRVHDGASPAGGLQVRPMPLPPVPP